MSDIAAGSLVSDLPPVVALTGPELVYLVQSQDGVAKDVHTTISAINELAFGVLLGAMQTAGVLTSQQVTAIEAALPGGSIIVPIPGASDGYIGLDDPGNILGH